MRATLDTNVFVSALNFGGIPARILDLHTDEAFTLCISSAITAEIERVLMDRFGWTGQEIEDILAPVFSRAEMIAPLRRIEVSRDPDDDRILECAVEAAVDVLVTGDNDLLQFSVFEGIRIITPRVFIELLRNP